MKKNFPFLVSTLAVLVMLFGTSARAQLVGDQIFLQGRYVEAGIAPNGSMGSTRLPPTGFHCNAPTFTFYDPALATTNTSNQRLMMVYDSEHDGWTTGTVLPFFGDYSMPGTPYEGWGIQVNGTHSEAHAEYYLGTTSGFSGGSLSGTNISYSNPSGSMIGVWQGSAGGLQITQTTKLDTNASWVNFTVKIKNPTSSAITGVYYLRETDPDNDEQVSYGAHGTFGTCGGSFTTANTIDHQNDYAHRVQVTARALCITDQTLSLSAKDCRAKCFIHSGWPMSTATNLATLWSSGGGGFTFSGSSTGDVAIGLVYNLGTIAAGDSTTLSYAYVFNGLLGIDSAIANPQIYVNGSAHDSVDTITACAFSGDTLHVQILNASTADWTGSTWTWAPSTYLTATTGTVNNVLASTMTSYVTYTITGTTATTGCSGKQFLLTVLPPGTTPSPTTTTSLSYCLGSSPPPLSASGIGTIYWWTTPTGGTGTTTAPTPSTAAVGTTTYYVSQVVAGCSSNRVAITVNVFALSTPITGSLYACTGYTTTLANASGGGTWVSSTPAVGTVGASTGVVSGISTGTTTISYLVSGCVATVVVTVTNTPGTISGVTIACLGSTTNLANSVAGGSWSSSAPSVASVGSSTGIVTGNSLGTAVITYNMGGGCISTTIITVNPYPNAITGASTVCVGACTVQSSTTPGGVWTSSTPSIATAALSTGNVCGIALGTATISYRVAGCAATKIMTVVNSAVTPSGPTSVCIGYPTVTYTDAVSGGTWSSSNTAVGTIVAATGVFTGIAAGTTTITYAISAGCVASLVVTVVPLPAAITGTLSVCQGNTTTLSHSVAGGTWSISPATVATVGISTGVVTGVATGSTSAATATVTYTVPGTGCITTSIVTVNPLPAAIGGTLQVCAGGGTTTLTDAVSGGTWSSGTATVATVDAAGTVTGAAAGTSTITYTSGTGCIATADVTVNPLPSAITGANSVCIGSCVTETGSGGGVWISGTPAVATVSGTGSVCGLSAGTTIITYALATGCQTTKIVTVTPGVTPITGSTGICIGNTTTLSTTTAGVTWSSSSPAIATIAGSGLSIVVTGNAVGTSTITATSGTGCTATVVVTVNSVPGAIGGTPGVCVGSTTTLTDAATGGTWASSNPAIGTIDPATGVLTGIATGTTTITYSLGTGCSVTAVATVNPLPAAIGGSLSICAGATGTLTDGTGGGTWSSGTPSVATIGVGTGVVTGGAVTVTSTTIITYAIGGTGCSTTAVLTVNPLPAAITGTASVCVGNNTTLSTATAGTTWTSSNVLVATVGATTGIVTGVNAGTATITTSTATCYQTVVVTVNALPTAISGTAVVCEGSTTALSSTPAGGTWSSSAPTIATAGAGTGIVTGVLAGTATITYTAGTGCTITKVVTVNPLPGAVSGSLAICVGGTTTLGSTPGTGTWSSSNTAVATAGVGTGVITGVSFGTATITYTLGTGCRRLVTVTVNPVPSAITGAPTLCVGSCITFSSSPSGGTWSSSNPAAGTVGATSGTVCGVAGGTTIITYSLGTGCIVTKTVTINALPVITGTFEIGMGSTATLTGTPSGGTWSSSTPAVGTIGTTTGVVGGVTYGTTTITYTNPFGCRSTIIETVDPISDSVIGVLTICPGQSTTFSSYPAGGAWSSSNTAIATIGTSGVATSVGPAGTTTISYTVTAGATTSTATAVLTVNPSPAAIGGTLSVCVGLTTALTDATTGGTWSSSIPAAGTIGSTTGIAGGVSAGITTITYTAATGCTTTSQLTVNALPAAISGGNVVCEASTLTLTSASAGGAWSASNGNVSIGATSGVLTGVNAGTSVVTYTLGTGCIATEVVSINAQPAAITGSLGVCIGFTTALADGTGGGTWSSSNTTVAPVSSTGVVSGNTVGTANIIYTLPSTGCARTAQVTVNPLPAVIAGSSAFCNLTSTTYTSATGGGTWSSSNTAQLTIDPATGVATGVSETAGVTITYTLPTGCITTKTVGIIFAPYPVHGDSMLCVGQSVTLTDTITGGVWSSSTTAIASVDAATGVATGNSLGIATITYVLSTGCFSSYPVTVNPTPGPIGGALSTCVGLTATVTNSVPGGVWSSSNTAIATVDPSTGLVSGIAEGTVTISYRMATSCMVTAVFTVNPLPADVTGTLTVCVGGTTTLYDATAGGTWSSSSPGIAYADPTSGVVTGIDAGTVIISYTLGTGCVKTAVVTVNPLPVNSYGPHNVCQGDSVLLANSTPGGVWVSASPAIATVSATGVVTGVSAGVTQISYLLATGCASSISFTVNGLPGAIEGSLAVCAGFATNLTDTTPSGTWTSDPLASGVGSINYLTGVFSAITPGTATVTYTLGSGCKISATVTVILLPGVIAGTPGVCVGSTTSLSDPVAGGTWSSSNAHATVNATTGVVTGVSAGSVVITYHVGTGCYNVLTVTVNPLPSAISGPSSVCAGSTIVLTDTSAYGSWISSNTTVATIDASTGVLTGVSGGVDIISYHVSTTECSITKAVTVNVTPPAIGGSGYVCISSPVLLTNSMTGGTWSSSNPSVATISTTGLVTPVTPGTSTISYTLATGGCAAAKVVTVSPLPVVYTVTGGGTYCAGGTGVHVGLSGSQIGVSYVLYYGSSATGYATGTGSALDFGLLTLAGTYSVQATYTSSGCTRDMAGSVAVIINPLGEASVSITTATGSDSSCPGNTVTLIPVPVNGGTAPTYLWSINGVNVSTADTYTFIPADGDVAVVRMTSGGGCLAGAVATGTAVLSVLESRTPTVGVTATPGDTVCQYSPATFTAVPMYGGSSPAYTWLVNGTAAGTGAEFAYIPQQGDVVSVQLTSNYLCRLATTVTSSGTTMTVDSLIVPHVTIVSDNGLGIGAGDSVTLRAIAEHAGPNPTYQWIVNGHPKAGATADTFRASYHDYDSVTCMVVSSGVCHNMGTFDWVFISVYPAGVNTVGNTASDIKLLPNPNKGLFTVRGTVGGGIDGTVQAEVTDMLGQVVYRGSMASVKGRVDQQVQLPQGLANGMYLLSLHTATETLVFHFVMEQ